MKRFLFRRLLPALALGLVAIQFVRPARNAALAPSPDDLAVKHPVPEDVRRTLEQACYDCHSNTTHYPWYAAVQPMAWWIDYHVRAGKRHLNFSQFGSYPAKNAAHKLGAVAEEVRQGDMPLPSYTWLHPEARLTAEQKKQLTAWADALHDQIAPK
jgi:signal recognition particle subunit SEC65